MSSGPNKYILVVVDVRSTHNVGSLFRTCDGLGVDLCLVGITPRPGHDNDSRLPHVVKKAEQAIAKTALGAERTVRWSYAENLVDAMKLLRDNGFNIMALEQSSESQNIRRYESDKPVALVVGREVEGLSNDEIAMCDGCLEIPMVGLKESFNVSVAAGIGLYQLTS